MIKGIFVCNLYDPRRDDFYDVFLGNIKDEKKREELKKIFSEYLSKVVIGDPKPTKLSKEELLSKNIVGLYTSDETLLNIFNLFSDNLTSTSRRRKKKIKSDDPYEKENFRFEEDDPFRNNLEYENIETDIDYTL